jgi:putative SOS response-associated peptidase YedK
MCGRYSIFDTVEVYARYGIDEKPTYLGDDNFNVSPGQFVPIVIMDEGERKIIPAKWGFIPFWAKEPKVKFSNINTVSEKVFDSKIWKPSILHKRCLIPARGFYEWRTSPTGEKLPHFIYWQEFKFFSFAGIYSIWKDAEGHPLYTFSIMTTEANKEVSEIHNRMPVILDRHEEAKWLNPEMIQPEEISEFLHPLPDGTLKVVRVGKEVNNPRNNQPSLLDPIQNSK